MQFLISSLQVCLSVALAWPLQAAVQQVWVARHSDGQTAGTNVMMALDPQGNLKWHGTVVRPL